MSTQAAHHHHNAAEHLTQAAFHHKQAQAHYEAGRQREALHHATLAQAHQHYASVWSVEASKAYLDACGTSTRAAVA
jgi:hypothetical protein